MAPGRSNQLPLTKDLAVLLTTELLASDVNGEKRSGWEKKLEGAPRETCPISQS